ncbi:polysaccharide deacetylase family protein [Streptomyces sp. NPDC028635]|uniref:polysaccharide deacetylase family protein n=1 Tax=Streptomyces sp. NPDC028635 TaxID=3154800 RepID=UPI0033F9041D
MAVLLAAVCSAVVCLAGCAQSVDPIERLGKKTAERVGTHRPAARPAYRRWGLSRPLAPAPAAARGRVGRVPGGAASGSVSGSVSGPGSGSGAGLPVVVDRVPTRDKVVFLTYDDGAERDPRFVDLVRELRLPVGMFLTDSVVGPGAGPGRAHFARLRAVGATLENHTLDHPAMRGLSYAGQRAEICGQQRRLRARFGVRPRLFRPPYGAYDATTLRAAGDCGISAVVLWRVSVGGDGTLSYVAGERRLGPGDIIAVDPDETTGPLLRERTVRLLREIQAGGLTVGRLEDYL